MKNHIKFTLAAVLLFLLPFNGISQTTLTNTPATVTVMSKADSECKALIEQARHGKPEAYRELAIRCRDGKGVQTSLINMLIYSSLYDIAIGNLAETDSMSTAYQEDASLIDTLIKSLNPDHPFSIIYNSLEDNNLNLQISPADFAILDRKSPTDAKVIRAMQKFNEDADSLAFLQSIYEAETAGCDLAYLIDFYTIGKTYRSPCPELLQALERISNHIPFLNNELGRMYNRMYYINHKDIAQKKKAVACFRKADKYGMLMPQYASQLISIYQEFGDQGITCTPDELARLKELCPYD